MRYRTTIDSLVFEFDDLKQVMAMASPARSGDYLAGIGAATAQQRMAAPSAPKSQHRKRLSLVRG